MAKRKSQSDHDKIVAIIADDLTFQHYSYIKADILGYEKPTKITWEYSEMGHYPDVEGVKEGKVIIEVETDDSIEDEHTQDKWILFNRYASQHGATFSVAVPDGYGNKADIKLRELGIIASIIEVDLN